MVGTFLMGSTCSIAVQSLGKIILRAPAVGAKIWCLYVQYDAPRPDHCSLEGGHSSNKYCVMVYGSILMRFSSFFRKGSTF